MRPHWAQPFLMDRLLAKLRFRLRYVLRPALLRIKVRFSRTLGSTPQAQRSTLILIPPDAPGSIGDEAMVQVCVQKARALGYSVCCLEYGPENQWSDSVSGIASTIDIQAFNDSSYEAGLSEYVARLNHSAHVLCIGADILDGGYGDYHARKKGTLLELAALAGVPSRILGFSFNESPSPGAVKVLASLSKSVRQYARDPQSLLRLRKAVGDSALPCADLAFLLTPALTAASAQAAADGVRAAREEGKTVIGFNPSAAAVRVLTKELREIVALYLTALVEVLETVPQSTVWLVAHDRGRNERSRAVCDFAICRELIKLVPPPYADRVQFVDDPVDAASIKSMVAELDYVVSSRMHLAIACLGSGTPVGCITYQGKFEGLYEHFGLVGLTMSSQEALAEGKIAQLVKQLDAGYPALRESINARLDDVHRLSGQNFDGIESISAPGRKDR